MTYVHRQLLSRTTEAGTLVQLPPALQRDQLSFGWVSLVEEQACWALTTPKTRARAVSLAYILLSLGRPSSLGEIVGNEESVVERMEMEERGGRGKMVFYRQLDHCFEPSQVISGHYHLRLVSSMSADSDTCEQNLAENSKPVAPGHLTRRTNGPSEAGHREATLSPPAKQPLNSSSNVQWRAVRGPRGVARIESQRWKNDPEPAPAAGGLTGKAGRRQHGIHIRKWDDGGSLPPHLISKATHLPNCHGPAEILQSWSKMDPGQSSH